MELSLCPECSTPLVSIGFGWYSHPPLKWKNTDNDPFSAGGNISKWYQDPCSLRWKTVKLFKFEG